MRALLLPLAALALTMVGLAWLPAEAGAQAAPTRLIGAGGSLVELPVGRGRLLRFDRAAAAVLIADPSVADVEVISPGLVYVFGVSVGETNVIAVDSGDDVIAEAELRVTRSAEEATRASRALLGPTAPDIDFVGDRPRSRGRVIDVEGAMASRTLAGHYAGPGGRALDLTRYEGSNQVNIRVRFAEVRRQEVTRLGINWNVLGEFGNFTLGLMTGAFLPDGTPSIAPGTFGTIAGGYSQRMVNVDLLLDALQGEGVVNILAEPNLTSISGRTASFLAGGEFAIPVPQRADVITVEFKRFGVALDFTPTVLPNNRIAIEVQPEVSTITGTTAIEISGFALPLLTVRRADATVELASGQTFAIAGLFQRELTHNLDQLPLLGDIPVLGELFRSRAFQRDETELVILITPYLVEPSQEAELALAGEAPPAGLPSLVPERASLTRGAAGFLLE